METEELELMVAENQISLDLDALSMEEKSNCLPEKLIKPLSHDYVQDEVLFVVVKVNNDEVCPNFADLSLCGKTTTDWLLLAGAGCECKVIEQGEELSKLKAFHTEKPIIAMFYSDTPLLDKISFNEIVDYFSSKGMNYLPLTRGLVIKTSYLERMSGDLLGDGVYRNNALLQVDSAIKLNYVSSMLYERIMNYHIKNGVVVFGEKSVFIDADVEIENGVVIYPNNVIAGQSIIEKGVVLQSGNIIVDSIISKNVNLSGCYIQGSKIDEGKVVSPLSRIINEKI